MQPQTKIVCYTMTPKEIYTQWCATQDNLPLFMQSWWLDAVCAGKEWDVILYQNPRTEQVLAVMPYLSRKRMWMRYVVMPQLTMVCGLWIDQSLMNDDGTVWDRKELLNICAYMESRLREMNLSYYYQQYPVNSPCIQPMHDLGFSIKKRHTYRLNDLSNLDSVIDAFSRSKKKALLKALSLHAEYGMNPEAFYRFHSQCYEEHHRKITYSREFLLVLERKTTRLNQGEILSICNADGEVYAAAYLAWDKHYLYYLMPCSSLKHKDSGAEALLALEAIKLARAKGVKFDFEGSMHRGLANQYKQFGTSEQEYYSVSKIYKWYFAIALVINWFRLLRYRM